MGNLLISFLIIFLTSVLFAALLYKFIRWINKPTETNGVNAIIPVYSTSTDIEQQVRFHYLGKNIERIILLNLGASSDTDHICKLLSKGNDFVYYCSSLDEIGVALHR